MKSLFHRIPLHPTVVAHPYTYLTHLLLPVLDTTTVLLPLLLLPVLLLLPLLLPGEVPLKR